MAIFERISDLVRANINDLIDAHLLALDYLNTLSKQDAINTLTNNAKFQENFPTYYTKLLSAMYSRAN